jgi:predicted RecA/RadA family phage recombinase
MNNFINDGAVLTLTLPYDRTSGQGFLVSNIFAVAATTALSGATMEGLTRGQFDLETSDTSATWSVGDLIYWDDSAKKTTKTNTSNKKIGVATAAKGSSAGIGRVRLDGVAVEAG